MNIIKPNTEFRIVAPDETYRYDDHVERNLVTEIFSDYVPEVARNPKNPFVFYEETYGKLTDLVKERKFFCFWLTSMAKGIPEEDDDGETSYPDSEHTSFHEPKEQIVDFICKWLASNAESIDHDMVESYFKKVLRKQKQNYFDNEYYGDSSDYSYLSIDKQEFIKDIQLFAQKSLQSTDKEKPTTSSKLKL